MDFFTIFKSEFEDSELFYYTLNPTYEESNEMACGLWDSS